MKMNIMNDVMVYIGTSSKSTFEIISRNNGDMKFGVCLNMFKFNNSLINKFRFLESLDIPLFMDNGSFERFGLFLKGEMDAGDYFNYQNARQFFVRITDNYKELLETANKPEDIILTIPEVIGSMEITQALQSEFISIYEDLQEKYGCKIIIALQFNPNTEEWINEVEEASIFVRDNVKQDWIVGIPFGNDFKTIQKVDNFNVISNVFRTTLKGYKAHLFACGALGKIEKFVLPNTDFIYSIDASSMMNIAKYSHYLSVRSKCVHDIRALKGKKCKIETQTKKLDDMKEDSGMTLEDWENKNYSERFEITIQNFQAIIEEHW